MIHQETGLGSLPCTEVPFLLASAVYQTEMGISENSLAITKGETEPSLIWQEGSREGWLYDSCIYANFYVIYHYMSLFESLSMHADMHKKVSMSSSIPQYATRILSLLCLY